MSGLEDGLDPSDAGLGLYTRIGDMWPSRMGTLKIVPGLSRDSNFFRTSSSRPERSFSGWSQGALGKGLAAFNAANWGLEDVQ